MPRKNVPDILVVRLSDKLKAMPSPRSRNLPELLMEATDEPYKVVVRAIERSVDRGYVEYGVSLNYCWPTPKGTDLLKKFGDK